jgi:predicted peroxiredoxin
MAAPTRSLVVKCTVGVEEPERCNQAFTVAATAVVAGTTVSMWLTGEATWLGVPERAESFVLPHAAPLANLRDTVLDLGTLTVCTQCAQRRGITLDDLLPNVRIAGSTTFVEEILQPDAQALVY